MEPVALRIEEAAKALGLSRSFVYELIGQGELRAFKVGRSRRIPKAELDRFIAAKLAEQATRPGDQEAA